MGELFKRGVEGWQGISLEKDYPPSDARRLMDIRLRKDETRQERLEWAKTGRAIRVFQAGLLWKFAFSGKAVRFSSQYFWITAIASPCRQRKVNQRVDEKWETSILRLSHPKVLGFPCIAKIALQGMKIGGHIRCSGKETETPIPRFPKERSIDGPFRRLAPPGCRLRKEELERAGKGASRRSRISLVTKEAPTTILPSCLHATVGLASLDDHRTCFDDAEDLAYGPSGGRTKQWLAGVLLAAVPVIYGIVCIQRGHTTLFGRGASSDVTGDAGFWLAVAYISTGAFLHFHYFWGLSERLWRYSKLTKVISLLIFLPSFLYTLYRIFV